jgi:hypothetical protein
VKLLLVGSFWEFSLETSYRRAFELIGVEVVPFNWDQYYQQNLLAKTRVSEKLFRQAIALATGKELIAAVQKENPDLVFVIKGRFIVPETLIQVKKILGDRPLMNFNPDSPWSKPNSTTTLLESIPIYDLHFTWSHDLVGRFQESGAKRVEYLPFAYDPALHFPPENIGHRGQLPEYDAVFVGTYDPVRDSLISQLIDFRIAIWGNDWHRSSLVPKECIKEVAVYGAASNDLLDKGVVALNLLREQNANSHNMRTFEIPATAHTMLTDRTVEQLSFFEEGKEIECFASIDELRSKLKFLISSEAGKEYGRHAFERVREETYSKRARAILDAL